MFELSKIAKTQFHYFDKGRVTNRLCLCMFN